MRFRDASIVVVGLALVFGASSVAAKESEDAQAIQYIVARYRTDRDSCPKNGSLFYLESTHNSKKINVVIEITSSFNGERWNYQEHKMLRPRETLDFRCVQYSFTTQVDTFKVLSAYWWVRDES